MQRTDQFAHYNRLTNCTFDGMVYNVQRVMEECLAIKPDLVFLWDEAWWGFAYFHYLLRVRMPLVLQPNIKILTPGSSSQLRTAMYGAQQLKQRFHSASYKEEYESWLDENGEDEAKMFDPSKRWYPNPATVCASLFYMLV